MAFISIAELHVARALAMEAVTYPTTDYFWRKICRWGCRALNLSIGEVMAMPLNELLQHYYESEFESLDRDERQAVLDKICKPLEVVADEEAEEEESLDEFEAMARAEMEETAQKDARKAAKTEAMKESPEKPGARASKPFDDFSKIPDFNTLPPDSTINFGDDLDPDDKTDAGWDLFKPQ